jgi:threonine aldolase
LLAGPAETIARGRLYRKRLGGGMRQAGVLAAAALVALEESPAKLAQDHANARFLAQELSQIPGIRVDAAVETNIVIFDVGETGLPSAEISTRLRERGVLINGINERQTRAVTHYDVDRAGCEQAIGALREIIESPAKRASSPGAD